MHGKWIIFPLSLRNSALKNAPGGTDEQRFNGLCGNSSRKPFSIFLSAAKICILNSCKCHNPQNTTQFPSKLSFSFFTDSVNHHKHSKRTCLEIARNAEKREGPGIHSNMRFLTILPYNTDLFDYSPQSITEKFTLSIRRRHSLNLHNHYSLASQLDVFCLKANLQTSFGRNSALF